MCSSKPSTIPLIGVVILLALMVSPRVSDAHPFHTSSMEMEWNNETNSFEVTVKLNPNDLERELRSITKKKVILEKLPSNEMIFQYVDQVFSVQNNGQKLKIKPVGFEVDLKFAWIYFEVAIPKQIDQLQISNRFLLGQAHQTNSLFLKYDKQKVTALFHEQRTTLTFELNEVQNRLLLVKPKQAVEK